MQPFRRHSSSVHSPQAAHIAPHQPTDRLTDRPTDQLTFLRRSLALSFSCMSLNTLLKKKKTIMRSTARHGRGWRGVPAAIVFIQHTRHKKKQEKKNLILVARTYRPDTSDQIGSDLIDPRFFVIRIVHDIHMTCMISTYNISCWRVLRRSRCRLEAEK